jgi:hypothetical protein
MSALDLLAHTAHRWGRALVFRAGMPQGTMRCRVALSRADGTLEYFSLQIEERDGAVAVREHGSTRLPWGCYERHLVDRGCFCLGLDEPWLYPTSEEVARTWWKMLRGFLYCQLDAELTREWTAQSWKHGIAAGVQHQLETIEHKRPRLVAAVRARRDNRCVLSMPVCWTSDSPHGRRDSTVSTISSLLEFESRAETFFWASQPVALRCCGSMKQCGLSKEAA